MIVELRSARLDDQPFVDDLTFTTMRGYVESTWPNDPDAWESYWRINKFDVSNTRIIQVGGKDVGRVSASFREDHVFIDEVHVLPDFQKQGMGRCALDAVIAEARERHLPVRLTVLAVNPAQSLYLRMGFKIVGFKDHRFHMQLDQD